MFVPIKAFVLILCCGVLAACSSGQATQGSSSPVGLRSGCHQNGEPVPFVRGGGDQFYYCSHP